LFCAFKTSTTDLVHFYDIITVKNVGTTIPLSLVIDQFLYFMTKFFITLAHNLLNSKQLIKTN
jgi:hypothetical protein